MKDEEKKLIYYVLLAAVVSVFLMVFSIWENDRLLIASGTVAIVCGFSLVIGGMMQRYREKIEEQK